MLRPRTTIESIANAFSTVLRRCDEEGVRLVLLSGANPSAQLPFRSLIQRRGDDLSRAVVARVADRPDVVRALNWPDRELSHPSFWSADRLHMNSRGHHRVAARLLGALGHPAPGEWWSMPEQSTADAVRGLAYYRAHVGPWVRRRLTGTSSGDGRMPKFGNWVTIEPAGA